ncbi:substrate-binding domain-containing protein [Amycolatopsis sacchari]|uniref:substrate-binding domain-containing protein n=1 Tax=Amycolatopsis sacchari TaxID=115433 RepID=UPI0015A57801|nr:substrate-binding domain-containing protein [Amycolatopsis sacchari]
MAAVGASLLLASACAATAGSNKKDGDYVIGVTTLFSSPIINEYTRGMQEAVQGTGVTLKINTSDSDVSKEASLIDTYITQHVDAILVDPISANGSVPAIRRAVNAGITVLCYDTCIEDSARQQLIKGYLTSDQEGLGRTAGEAAAKYITEKLGGHAKIGILSCDASYAICGQRQKGFESALAPGSYDIVAKQEGYVVDKAKPLASDMLTAHPELNLIFGQNEGSAIGAALTVKSDQRAGVHVFGIDITTVIADLMLQPDPALLFTAGQDAGKLGADAVRATVAVLNGTPPVKETQLIAAVPYSADHPETLRAYIDERK